MRTWGARAGAGNSALDGAFADAAEEVPLEAGEEYPHSEAAAVTRRVLQSAAPPTALIYDNDVMAVAGVAAASELGSPSRPTCRW